MSRSICVIATLLIFSTIVLPCSAADPRPPEVPDPALTEAMEAYATCVYEVAEAASGELDKTPEVIADHSHTSCLGLFERAKVASLRHLALPGAQGEVKSPIDFTNKRMDEYRVAIRINLISLISRKRRTHAA